MTADKFVGDATREPQLRIGVLMATLRLAKADIDLALDALDQGDVGDARKYLTMSSADIAERLDLMAKADGE